MSLVLGDNNIRISDRLNLKPVLVIWEDACQGGGWVDGEEVDLSETIVESVGWLAHMTDAHMILMQSITDGEHANTVQIPAGMVRSVTYLVGE